MAEPTTSTMNVSLPEQLKKYIDDKVLSGMYGSASEVVREAIREKIQREIESSHARSILELSLIEGLDTGTPKSLTDTFAESKKATLKSRLGTNFTTP